MPLQYIDEPINGAKLVATAIDSIATRQHSPLGNIPFDETTSVETIRHSTTIPPIPVYTLVLGKTVTNNSLQHAKAAGFFYILEIFGEPGGRAYVLTDSSGIAVRVVNLSLGNFAKQAMSALAELKIIPQVANGTFELRILRSAGLYLHAFWLKSIIDDNDLIYPLGHSPNPLANRSEPPYNAGEFISSLRPLSHKRIRMGRSFKTAQS